MLRLTDARFAALRRTAEPDGPGTWRLVWRPSRWDRRKAPDLPPEAEVAGRLVEVPAAGEAGVLRLFVSDAQASAEEAAAAYALRWSVEGDIRDLKQTLGLDRLSGRSPEMIAKELLLGITAFNLVAQTRRPAARRAGLPPRRLSFAGVRSLVEAFVCSLAHLPPEQWSARFDDLLRAAVQRKLPHRHRPRSYPRELIPRRRKFPERKRKNEN